ncbi:MAG: SOS mutagenesis and repair UmuC protein [Candidatus Pelagibacterales bacterium]|nr:MAG: SOS mutagenesis and repair UmuC protein [Pelagibacterales bacterium]
MRDKVFALIDCNAFYVSCERVFNPKLNNRPVVALSNNDGCIISRSKEAKALGIKMGVPLFKVKDIVEKEKVVVFSSNYTLYADMSRRVMNIISSSSPYTEIYSIDEAFVELSSLPIDYESYAHQLRQTILQHTGIPVSIGIASTKTLAKVANHKAKKDDSLNGVCSLVNYNNIDQILELTEVGDVWGVGRRLSKKLINHGIHNAKLLKNCSDSWIRKMMSVNGLKTITELRGISCIPLEEYSMTRKSCCTTRSFGKLLTNLEDIEQAVTTFARRAAERIRSESLAASCVSVFVRTNPFDKKSAYYSNGASRTLSHPTHDSITIIETSLLLTKRIFKNNYQYKKAGVLLSGLCDESEIQETLFEKNYNQNSDLMSAIDAINYRYGRDTLQMASECKVGNWKQKRENCTRNYTTQIDRLLLV